jgi:hypothetical protein
MGCGFGTATGAPAGIPEFVARGAVAMLMLVGGAVTAAGCVVAVGSAVSLPPCGIA